MMPPPAASSAVALCGTQSAQIVSPFKLIGILRTSLPFSSNTCSTLYWISAPGVDCGPPAGGADGGGCA